MNAIGTLIPRTRTILAAFVAALVVAGAGPTPSSHAQCETTPELTDYGQTSTYADVVAFLQKTTATTPNMELTWMGETVEGHRIPVVVVAPPDLRHPTSAHASGRLIAYVQGNIHAGEVEGKEACQMLLREIAAGNHDALLENYVLLVAPIYNIDGNEKISTMNRRNQIGPKGGVGVRPNAQNLDLNRDYMKMRAPETRASVGFFNVWDPHLLMDLHTTNGSKHRYALTYSASNHPNADRTLHDFTDHTLLPEISEKLRPEYETFYYGNWMDRRDPSKGWATFGWAGRFCTNYYGLRNRFSVLSEAYAYRDFKTRTDVTLKFIKATLARAAAHKTKMMAMIRAADRRLVEGAWKQMGIEHERVAWPAPRKLLGYKVTEESRARGPRPTKDDVPQDYEGLCHLAFVPKRSIDVPAGYVFDAGLLGVAKLLCAHGISVYRTTAAGEAEVDAAGLKSLERSKRLFQGAYMQHAVVDVKRKQRALPAGSFYVPLRQPLGRVAAELLDPEGRDGVVAWGLIDNYLAKQWSRALVDVPIYRLCAPLTIPRERFQL